MNAGTAPLHAVTDVMMDHAAHQAAELADGVAHHRLPPTLTHDDPGEAPLAAPSDTAAVVGAEATVAEIASDGPPDVPGLDTTVHDADPVMAAEPPMAELSVSAAPATSVAAEAEEALGRLVPTPVESGPDASAAFALYNAKVLDMMRGNMAAAGAHMAALFQAKSVPEAVALNADHLRRQIEVLTAQGRELTALAQTLTFEALQPLKDLIASDR